MSDLSELDRQIVEAAEKWEQQRTARVELSLDDTESALRRTVWAKRAALKELLPSCSFERVVHPGGRCNQRPSVQRVDRNDGALAISEFYCEAHRTTSTDIWP